jgi:hypothetical protein
MVSDLPEYVDKLSPSALKDYVLKNRFVWDSLNEDLQAEIYLTNPDSEDIYWSLFDNNKLEKTASEMMKYLTPSSGKEMIESAAKYVVRYYKDMKWGTTEALYDLISKHEDNETALSIIQQQEELQTKLQPDSNENVQ